MEFALFIDFVSGNWSEPMWVFLHDWVTTIHPEEEMKLSYGNPWNSCWHTSFITTNVNPLVALDEKSPDHGSLVLMFDEVWLWEPLSAQQRLAILLDNCARGKSHGITEALRIHPLVCLQRLPIRFCIDAQPGPTITSSPTDK